MSNHGQEMWVPAAHNRSVSHETEAVERMTTYIAEHLHDPITARDVSDAAGYSQYHAGRIFKKQTGLTLFEYIRRERLLASAHVLRQGKTRVLDVALDFVFDSHEGFTRAFANGFGITPKKFADVSPDEGWLVPYRYLNRSKVQNMDQTAVIFTQIIERPQRKLILKRSRKAEDYFSYCEEVGCGQSGDSTAWDVLSQIKEALYEPVGLWLPDTMRPTGTGVYAHGVEVAADYAGEIPDATETLGMAGVHRDAPRGARIRRSRMRTFSRKGHHPPHFNSIVY